MALGNLLQGYEAARKGNQAESMQEVQQFGALQQIMAKQQAAQQEQQFRAELAALGPNPSQEALTAVAAKYSPAQSILTSQTASRDRAATLEAATANREATRVQAQSLQDQRIAEQQAGREQRGAEVAASRAQRMEELQMRLQDSRTASADRMALTRELAGMRADAQREAAATRADKPMTEFQGKAALYGTRAAQSDKVLKALEDKISLTGLAAGQATGMVGNALMSSEQQRVNQAQRDFVNAVLRQESGAVISDQEFANAKQQYFPAPGDSKAVLDQKRANRQLAIQGFARMSGPKGSTDIKAIIDNPLLPGVSDKPVTPQQNAPMGQGFSDPEKERRYQEWKARQK